MEGTRRNIFDNALCLSVRKHKFGTNKKVDKEMVQEILASYRQDESTTQIDSDLVNLTKKIYDSPALKEIRKIYSEVNQFLERYTVVGALLKPGTYVVPDDHVDAVDRTLREKIEALQPHLKQLREEYEAHVELHLEKLGALGSYKDYPSADEVVQKFKIEYEFLAHDVPQKLRYINSKIWQREQEKAQERVAVVAERIEQILIAQTAELVDYMIERLTDHSDGKRKKFATHMIDRAKEFFETLRTKNLTGSEEVDQLARRGQEILDGVELDQLKDDQQLRQQIRARFEEVKDMMASMIVAAPRRAIRLRGNSDAVLQETPQVQGNPAAEERLRDLSEAMGDEDETLRLRTMHAVDEHPTEPEFYPDAETYALI
jgi:hypothetical protein